MEVGVCVDAYAVGGPTRNINNAYFTFIAPDEDGNPKCLPKVKPKDLVWSHCFLSLVNTVLMNSYGYYVLYWDGVNSASNLVLIIVDINRILSTPIQLAYSLENVELMRHEKTFFFLLNTGWNNLNEKEFHEILDVCKCALLVSENE